MCHKSEHLTRIRQTYINLHHIKHQNLRETTQRIRRVPECRARGSRVPSTRCRLECPPGRCGSRCTLSFLLRNTKEIDEMKMDKRNKRDMRLSRRLSFATMWCLWQWFLACIFIATERIGRTLTAVSEPWLRTSARGESSLARFNHPKFKPRFCLFDGYPLNCPRQGQPGKRNGDIHTFQKQFL